MAYGAVVFPSYHSIIVSAVVLAALLIDSGSFKSSSIAHARRNASGKLVSNEVNRILVLSPGPDPGSSRGEVEVKRVLQGKSDSEVLSRVLCWSRQSEGQQHAASETDLAQVDHACERVSLGAELYKSNGTRRWRATKTFPPQTKVLAWPFRGRFVSF